MKKLDILAFGAHPDDVELACSGTLIKAVQDGKKIGIITLTKAELGTRGSVELRTKEFAKAAKIIGASIHESLNFPDGHVSVTDEAKLIIIQKIRDYKPTLVFLPYWEDRHPDHGNASRIIQEASFLAGLKKIETGQEPFRPAQLLYYMSTWEFQPDFVFDISEVIEIKLKAIQSYSSQIHDKDYQKQFEEEETFISSSQFWDFLMARAAYYGHRIGKKYGEPFKIRGLLEIKNLFDTFGENVY
jgi:N-acetylglucosamine malate deacetylase 1